MTPAQSIKTCLRKYASFSGRASRSEFWWFALFSLSVLLLFTLLADLIFGINEYTITTRPDPEHDLNITKKVQTSFAHPIKNSVLSLSLATIFLPFFSAASRRHHDMGWPAFAPKASFVFLLMVAGITLLWPLLLGDVSRAFSAFLLLVISYFALAALVPFTLFLSLFPSQPHSNQFGPNPHEVTP